MRRVLASLSATFLLFACGPNIPQEDSETFNFADVFEGTAAGEIDRTIVPRRPNGPPNIVLIIADDLGWPYLGFLGDDNVITPNMDILGNGGVVFETGHATSNFCRPTLQSLITGLYPHQYHDRATDIATQQMSQNPISDDIDTDAERSILYRQFETGAIEQFQTLPRILSELGYASHQSGKWWEQSYAHGGFTEGMTESWDWQEAAGQGDEWFFTFMGGEGNKIGRRTMAPVTDFIERNSDQPFFVWYGPALPHTPLNAPDRFYKYYENREDLSESARLYYANIAWFDWGVGALIDSLREQRVLDNTLIVYVNDNGWEQPANVEYANNQVTFANGGPRGKGSFFETGFRTPIIFYWQGDITPVRDTDTFASALDIMPTILDYVGVEAPTELPGYSLKPAIEQQDLPDPRAYFIGRMTQHRAGTDFRGAPDTTVRDNMGAGKLGYYRRDHRWHFVWLPDTDETALYDLENDPGQLTDVSGAHASLLSQFKGDIAAWQDTYERNMP